QAHLGQRSAQPLTPALGNLAVLLLGPSQPAAELLTPWTEAQLRCEHEALIVGQRSSCQPQTVQLESQQRGPLDVGAYIGDVHRAFPGRVQRDGRSRHELAWAATGECPTAIVYARQKSLLERVSQMAASRAAKRPSFRLTDQLERRLAVAVLEV